MMVRSNFWRMDADLPDMIRWISWGKANFVAAVDKVHFEYRTKQRYGFGAVDPAAVDQGLAEFRRSARRLEDHLQGRADLLDSGLSYADFRIASYLLFNDVACLPLDDDPNLARGYARLTALPQWQDPFVGVAVPALPWAAPGIG